MSRIPAPTDRDLVALFRDRVMTSLFSDQVRPVCLLVPHASHKYSGICAGAAYQVLLKNPPKEVYLIGTNHQGDNQNSVFNPTAPIIQNEHSIQINLSFLRHIRVTNVKVCLTGTNTNLKEFAEKILVPWWMENPNERVIVFSSDLTHDVTNQQTIQTEEEGLLELLTNHDGNWKTLGKTIQEKLNQGELQTVCGKAPIVLLAHVMELLKLYGKVVCYDDSAQRRRKWLNRTSESRLVSYVSMLFYLSFKPPLSPLDWVHPHDDRLLLAFARSVVASEILSLPQVSFPSWCVWSRRKNGIFVGIRTRSGQPLACMGRFENGTETTSEFTIKAALNTIEDAKSGRLSGSPLVLTKENIRDYRFYVEILDEKETWKTANEQYLKKLKPEDRYGFYLKLANGRSATYLPDVWEENISTWGRKIENVLQSLSQKAGGNKDDWKLSDSSVMLYKARIVQE